jgi:hypothetical protein
MTSNTWLYTLPNVKVSHRVARLDEIRIGHTPYTAHPNLILESKFWILSHVKYTVGPDKYEAFTQSDFHSCGTFLANLQEQARNGP